MKHNVCTVGIDLAKTIFHLVGTDTTGKLVWRKRLTRHALIAFMAQLPVFSAKYPPVHVPGKGPQSLAGAPLPRDVKGRSGH